MCVCVWKWKPKLFQIEESSKCRQASQSLRVGTPERDTESERKREREGVRVKVIAGPSAAYANAAPLLTDRPKFRHKNLLFLNAMRYGCGTWIRMDTMRLYNIFNTI